MSTTSRPATELETIKKDTTAAVADRGDHQASNRLALDVMNYVQHHKSPAELHKLENTLTGGGLSAQDAQQLEKMGFPKMHLTDDRKGPQNVDAIAQPAKPQPEAANSPQATNSDLAPAKPKTLADIVHEVHSVEDRYHMTDWASARTQSDLVQAEKDVQKFCKDNPDQAKALISKLESQDLIGQLSIAAIEQTSAGQSGRSLTKDDVTGLFAGNDPFNTAIRTHLDRAFSVTPGGKDFGTGYADGITNKDGHEQWRYPTAPSDVPIITKRHLDELMGRFDHGPAYRREEL